MTSSHTRLLIALCVCGIVSTGCGGRAYLYESVDDVDFRSHSETQSDGPVTVSTSVLGPEETQKLFGLSLYDKGVQPVWLEIENNSAIQIRYAPAGTDRLYFSPLEVAYTNRRGFSDEARAEMDRRFHRLAMPRYIDAGETRSGFVFTHADLGAKGFNVDVFGGGDSKHFNFLMRVPGFVPDYANIDFDSIYASDKISLHDRVALYDALKNLPCCSVDASGAKVGDPINVILIGAGKDLLQSLLRSRWVETSAKDATNQELHFLYGRPQDAIFRYHSVLGDSYYELRLWLAPMMTDDNRVWAGQVRHFYNSGTPFHRFDPDVDNARSFTLQNLLYGQSLIAIGWIAGEEVAPVESFWGNLFELPFFSDGFRAILWLSGAPASMANINRLKWDQPPVRAQ